MDSNTEALVNVEDFKEKEKVYKVEDLADGEAKAGAALQAKERAGLTISPTNPACPGQPPQGPTVALVGLPPSLGPTVAQQPVTAGARHPSQGGGIPTVDVPLQLLIAQRELEFQDLPLFQRLRRCLPWWRKWASPQVLSLVQTGIRPNWSSPPTLSLKRPFHCPQDLQAVQEILADYQCSGAVRRVSGENTHHLIPWFILSKSEGDTVKRRLISDCRELNQYLSTTKFRLDHLHNIFPYLRQGNWAGKIDLKDAYFHLGLHPDFRPFLRMAVQDQIWEFQSGCFGLSLMPQLFMQVMKTFEKKWRKRGLLVFVYLDDILLVGNTEKQVQVGLSVLVHDLLDSGFKINTSKSVLTPTQQVCHLGFLLNFQSGRLEVAPHKVKAVRKELGKLVTHQHLSARKMAAILGQVRSFLVAMPFLRCFTDTLCTFVREGSRKNWDCSIVIPQDLKEQLLSVKSLLDNYNGRPFPEKHTKTLHSDSSTLGWAGLDLGSGHFVQDFWRDQVHLHINVKELKAAIDTVRSFARPHSVVQLSVDNQVAFYYLTRGGGGSPTSMH